MWLTVNETVTVTITCRCNPCAVMFLWWLIDNMIVLPVFCGVAVVAMVVEHETDVLY